MAMKQPEDNRIDLREILRKKRESENEVHIHNTTTEIVISVDDVIVDEEYQRKFKPKKAREIAKNFDPDLFDKPLVARRPDGKFAVIDGQTRIGSLRIKWPGKRVTFVADLAVTATTKADEAKRFNGRNTYVSKAGTGDELRALIVEGDEDAIAFERIVNQNGFSIKWGGGRTKSGQIGAYLFKSVRKYCGMSWEQDLDDALSAIADAWGANSLPVVPAFVTGVALMFKRYRNEPAFDRDTFVSKIAKHTPASISADGNDARKWAGKSTRHEYGCRTVLRAIYNSRRTQNPLPEF